MDITSNKEGLSREEDYILEKSVSDESKRINVLFLASNPTDQKRLNSPEEFRQIENRLDEKNFNLQSSWALRPKEMLEKILFKKPQIVHFSGHGSSEGGICLMNTQGETQIVSPQALSTLFKLVADFVKCVVLNTCYSKIQADAIAEHIPFVIGMNTTITDKSAIEFSAGFYTSLRSEGSIEKAFHFGCATMQLEGFDSECSTPQLMYGEPRARFHIEVERLGKQLQDKPSVCSKIYRKALIQKGNDMGLSPQEIDLIVNEVIEKFNKFQEKTEQYKTAYKDALAVEFPISEETYEALGYLLDELGLKKEDVKDLERELENDPKVKSAESFYKRGIQKSQILKKYSAAINDFNEAIEYRPDYSAAFFYRAKCYENLGQGRNAIEDFTSAIDYDKSWEGIGGISSAYFDRGLTYFNLKEANSLNEDMNAAIEDWTKTLDLIPNYANAYYNRALAWTILGNHDKAVQDYTEVIKLDENLLEKTTNEKLATTYLKRSISLNEIGDIEKSNKDFKKAVILMKDIPQFETLFSGYEHLLKELKDEIINDVDNQDSKNNNLDNNL